MRARAAAARPRPPQVVLAALALLAGAGSAPLGGQTPTEMGAGGFREEAAPQEWDGSADLGFTLTKGNSETSSFSAAGELVYRLGRQRWSFNAAYVRATTDGEETANKGDAELMYDFFPTGRFFLFAKTSGAFNEPAGLDLRLAPGGGVGYQVLDTERTALSFEAGGEWTHDEFDDGSTDDAARASATEAFSWSLSGTTDLEQSVAYRPDASDFGDFLLDARVSISTTVVEGLGLKVSFRDEFDSEPFVDPDTGEPREENDITFVTGLTYQF